MTRLTRTQQYVALCWLLTILVTSFWAATRFDGFDSSILKLLPEFDQMPYVQQASEQLAGQYANQILILARGPSDAVVRDGVANLAGRLQGVPAVAQIRWKIDKTELQRHQAEHFPYRFFLLDDATRQFLKAGEFERIQQRALGKLFGPLSVGAVQLDQDPFGLAELWQSQQPLPLSVEFDRDLLRVAASEQSAYLVLVTLASDPFSPQVQAQVLSAIESIEAEWTPKGVQFLQSGMLQHAAAGAKQAKQEISTIGLLSLVGIILMLWWVFRTWRPIVLMTLAVFVGCLMALSVSLLVFERVHLVTLTFGAGLVGVAVDYALHYLCASYAKNWRLKRILPALLLGLFSSVMAYSAQAMAPFPGLRQMAVFSVVGLIAAWLTVVLWFPLCREHRGQNTLNLLDTVTRLRKRFPRIETDRRWGVCLLLLSGLAVLSLFWGESQDDIRLLQSSPPALLQQEAEVQRLLGLGSSNQFLLIHAENLQACLEKEESIRPALDAKKASGVLNGYLSLSQVLPSLSRQQQNEKWVEALYAEQLQPMFRVLQLPSEMEQGALRALHDASRPFSEADWFQQPGNQDWRNFVVRHPDGSVSTLIRLTGLIDSTAKNQLVAFAQSHDGVRLVNRVEDISNLMTSYRVQVVTWVGVAYLVVALVLLFRFKREVWRVVLPPFLASIYTLAILAQLDQGLNLFHWLALILVLGIGLDMGIFLMEVGDAPHTWLAVCLSAGTSLMAFGLLSSSQTPILHHFGLTVLLGLTGVLLIAPLMRKMESGNDG